MASSSQTDRSVWSRTQGQGKTNWSLTAFGLIFLLASLFLIFVTFRAPGEGDTPIPWYLGLTMALGFALGPVFAFLRRGLRIDNRSQTITIWWGWIVELTSKQYPLSRFQTVLISKTTPGKKGAKQKLHVVELIGDLPNITVDVTKKYFDARDLAIDLADFCSLAIEDQAVAFGKASRPKPS